MRRVRLQEAKNVDLVAEVCLVSLQVRLSLPLEDRQDAVDAVDFDKLIMGFSE